MTNNDVPGICFMCVIVYGIICGGVHSFLDDFKYTWDNKLVYAAFWPIFLLLWILITVPKVIIKDVIRRIYT